MAIYSLNVASVGKTTHQAGTAGAHLRYIARPEAEPIVLAEHMPDDANAARAWMDAAEEADRKNARVMDKIRIALPRELTEAQRAELLRAFCQDITGNQTPWFAAIHQSGEDAHNPHAHIVVRDRSIQTGQRVLRWSDNARDRQKAGLPVNAVEHIRERWELIANQHLECAGLDARIDRRTLEAQGIEREPTIHIGPRAAEIEARVQRPVSKDRTENRWWRRYRDITPYEYIDAGRTRQERNAEIIDLNLERAARSPDFETRERARFLKDQIAADRRLERELVTQARRRTHEQRQAQGALRADVGSIRSVWRAEQKAARGDLLAHWKQERGDLRQRHDAERDALKQAQGRLLPRLFRIIDITGRTRRRQSAESAMLRERHAAERKAFVSAYRSTRTQTLSDIAERHEPRIEERVAAYRSVRAEMAARHADMEKQADQQRQARAAERAEEERRLEAVFQRLRKTRQHRPAQERGPRLQR